MVGSFHEFIMPLSSLGHVTLPFLREPRMIVYCEPCVKSTQGITRGMIYQGAVVGKVCPGLRE